MKKILKILCIRCSLNVKADILTAILESDSDLIDSRDEDGLTPLSFAASIGYDIGVNHMLTRFASSTQLAYIKNEDGSFPIHSACSASCTSSLKVILKHHPDTIEMLNSQGQNVLHVAAKSGNAGAAGYLFRKADIKRLINEQDVEGNTPLHLASINSHPKIVSLFIHDSRVDLKILNYKGFTALDAAEDHMAAIPSLQEVWPAFKCRWIYLHTFSLYLKLLTSLNIFSVIPISSG